MTEDHRAPEQGEHVSLEEAAAQGPLPGNVDGADEDTASTREDHQQRDGVIPATDNDLDPDRDLTTEQRERRIAGDETVGGIFQSGTGGG